MAVPGSARRTSRQRSAASAVVGRPGDGTLRILALGTWVLVTLGFWTSAADPLNLPKLTVLMVGSLALVLVLAVRATMTGTLGVPAGAPVYALAAFVAAAVIVSITAPVHWLALMGDYQRNIGLALYLCCAVAFLVVARTFRVVDAARLGMIAIAMGGWLGVYGLLQRAHLDPVGWVNPYNPIITTLGNPDFASALFGILVPFAAWGAMNRHWRRWQRVASALSGLLMIVSALLSYALEGWIAAAAGLALVALGWVLAGEERRRCLGLRIWGGVVALAVVVGGLGLLKIGPLKAIGEKHTLTIREYYWAAAWRMFIHHPIIGVGMSGYGDNFDRYRSVAAVRLLGGNEYSNAAHDVPLAFLSTGGLLLFLSYAAFVGVVGWRLVRALRRGRGDQVLLLSAVGGAWLAYQVQSLVSIDDVALALVHFVLAGVVVALTGGTGQRRLSLRRVGRPGFRLTSAHPAVATAAVVLLGVGVWAAARPVWADHQYYLGGAGNAPAADAAYVQPHLADAASLMPSQPRYWWALAASAEYQHNAAAILVNLRKGYAVDPYVTSGVVDLAEFYAQTGQAVKSLRWYHRALSLDPHDPTLMAEVATEAAKMGPSGVPEAARLLHAALAIQPNAAYQQQLAALHVTG